MCGIIAIVGTQSVAEALVAGLKRMEYRGYDSAGLCTIAESGFERCRAAGKIVKLEEALEAQPVSGRVGIAHTRWATHGAPTILNAHPHATEEVALVHNGIIENFAELRAALLARGRKLEGETDSEVVAHLLSEQIEAGNSPEQAVQAVLPQLRGAFALAMLFRAYPDKLIGARLGAPLLLGSGESGACLGSDALALAPIADELCYLEEGDWAVLTREGYQIYDRENRSVTRESFANNLSVAAAEKGNYRHYMQKEIFEQSTVVAQSLAPYLQPLEQCVTLPQADFDIGEVEHVTIAACGTSLYAGMVAKYWFEHYARLSVDVEIASELRYRNPIWRERGLSLFISQSGETADTLAALSQAKAAGQRTAALVNVPTSSIARGVDYQLPIHAGPEIGVASTKAFMCQLAVLLSLSIAMAARRGSIDRAAERSLVAEMLKIPSAVNAALDLDESIAGLAGLVSPARDVLYMGRGTSYPLALEGALKLKEISYIHAEGYAGGEMKHGPIALIDADVPVVVLAPSGDLFAKTVSNMQEIIARGAQVLFISDSEGIANLRLDNESSKALLGTIEMPRVSTLIAPLVYTVPVQLLAYHVAVAKGTDVDQPRNLAKSVTVE